MVEICQTCLSASGKIFPMSSEDVDCYRLFIPKIEDPLDIILICGYCKGIIRKINRFIKQCRLADAVLKKSLNNVPEIFQNISSSQCVSKTICHYMGPDLYIKIKNEIKTSVNDDDIPLLLLNENNDKHEYDAELSPEILPGLHSAKLSVSKTICHYMGPDSVKIEDEVVKFAVDEDDIPLVLLNQTHNDYDCNGFDVELNNPEDVTVELKTEYSKSNTKTVVQKDPKKFRKKKEVREGFSSRMVTETDEYEVIKLTKEEIIEKMRQHSESERYIGLPYKCEQCVRGFNFEDVLQSHMEKHSPKNGPFKCELCAQYCPSKVSLRGHMKSHSTRYKCKLCGLVRMSRQHILEHHALQHTGSAALYRCPSCDHTTNKRTAMQRHVRVHSSSERLKCSFCEKYYKNKESLRIHMMRHDHKNLHQCEMCTSSFVYAAQLAKHVRAVHERKEFYCVECDVMFKSMDNLKQHLSRARRHRDDSSYKFQCGQCSQRFVSAATLATHQSLAHGAPKRAACPACARRYSSAEALRWHVRRAHRPRAPALPCALCDRLFARKSVLRAHMRTHAAPCDDSGHRTQHKKPAVPADNEA